MKITLLTAILALSATLSSLNLVAAESVKPSKLNHVVSFKFKQSASQESINALVKAFKDLPRQIKEIRHFEWGTNVSPENHDKGFTHCFILTFNSAKDRDTYLVHPAHKEFGSLVGPIVEDVFVIDFWVQK